MSEATPASRAAFEQLYVDTVDGIFSYIAARVGSNAAEELTADVFCAAARLHNDGRGAELTPAWLQAVARNKVIDRWRSTANRRAKDHLIVADHRGRADSDPAIRAVQRDAVLAALDHLDDLARMMLVMRYLDNQSVGDIAAHIGRSRTATHSALARARRSLRAAYEQETRHE